MLGMFIVKVVIIVKGIEMYVEDENVKFSFGCIVIYVLFSSFNVFFQFFNGVFEGSLGIVDFIDDEDFFVNQVFYFIECGYV